MAISSTDCRAGSRRGEPVWYLVPDGVVQYIAKRGLYRAERTRYDQVRALTDQNWTIGVPPGMRRLEDRTLIEGER